MQSENLTSSEIRMRAIEAAASVSSPTDDIGNLLAHADWIASYVTKGTMPAVDEESPVARGAVQSA